MNRNNRTGSHLFFIEFIIVLFFFLIVSTVCLRLFARAHGITQRADALSHAQAAAASVAAVVEDILPDAEAEVSTAVSSGNIDDENTGNTTAAATDDRTTGNTTAAATDGRTTENTTAAATDDRTATNLLLAAAEYLPGASLTILPDNAAWQEGLTIFYDSTFEPCTAKDACFLLTASIDSAGSQNGQEATLVISVTDYDHTPVYELSVTLYRPMTRKEALR